MTYKTILAHCHDVRRVERLLQVAVPLARAVDGHLLGVAVIPPFVVVPAMDGAASSVTVEDHRIAYAKDLAAVQGKFEDATSERGALSEWRVVDASFGTAADCIVEQGRCADLVIVAQADSEWSSSALLEDPERVVLSVGRPVLVVPNAGAAVAPPKRVSIAWNGRREAARAVFDALPLLQHAELVDVLGVNSGQDRASHGDLPAAEICAALARHGVKCQSSEASAVSGDVGAELLRQAKAFGADMLVMGCYGHSQLREFVLGGASRYVLRNMHVPVLMSH